MFARLALLFVVVPVLELVLLVQMGRWVGLLPTLALVVTTGIVGAWLARLEGLRVLLAAQNEMQSGRIPTDALLGGVSVLIGGALLLTPGILTDVLGFSLLVPFTRRFWTGRMRAFARRGIEKGWIQARVVGFDAFGARSAPMGRRPEEPEVVQEAEVVQTTPRPRPPADGAS